MNAQATLRFEGAAIDVKARTIAVHAVNVRCLMCDGTGWRPVIAATGDRAVTRCECRRRRPVLDYKAAAAGDR